MSNRFPLPPGSELILDAVLKSLTDDLKAGSPSLTSLAGSALNSLDVPLQQDQALQAEISSPTLTDSASLQQITTLNNQSPSPPTGADYAEPIPVTGKVLTSYHNSDDIDTYFSSPTPTDPPPKTLEELVQQAESSHIHGNWHDCETRMILPQSHYNFPLELAVAPFSEPSRVSFPNRRKRYTEEEFHDSALVVSTASGQKRRPASNDSEPVRDLVLNYRRNENAAIDVGETLEDHKFRSESSVFMDGLETGVKPCDVCGGEVDMEDFVGAFRCTFALGMLQCGNYRCGGCWDLVGGSKVEGRERCKLKDLRLVKKVFERRLVVREPKETGGGWAAEFKFVGLDVK